MKRLILLFALLTGIVTANSLTAQTVIASGDCGVDGDNLTWELTDNGVLTISGSGAMANYDLHDNYPAPWLSHISSISILTISNAVTSIGNEAFYDCSNLTSVTIPNSVTTIGNEAFFYCSNLTSITIPNSVTNIGNEAFFYCSNLTSITIPNSVTNIGDYAFGECSGLTSVEIPNSVTNIGESAFSGCSGLTSVEIPNSVTNIGNSAFAQCSGLTSIQVDAANPHYSDMDGILYDKMRDTLICYPAGKMGNISIPNLVTTIGNSAFRGCNGLTSVLIPNSVTNIGDRAFYYCNNLTLVTIGNSVTNIGNVAFSHCNGLTSLTIPNSVTNIGFRVFDGCNGLTSVTIGNSVTNIGHAAFIGCSGLTTITCLANIPPAFDDSFHGIPNTIPICVPTGSVATYQSSNWGSTFANISGCAPIGISEMDEEDTTILLYPNPAQNTFQIRSSLTIEQLTIYDISGRVLKQVSDPESVIEISSLAKGIYWVKLKTEKGEVMRKVIKD